MSNKVKEIVAERPSLVDAILHPLGDQSDLLEKKEREAMESLVASRRQIDEQILQNTLELRDALWNIVLITHGQAPLEEEEG